LFTHSKTRDSREGIKTCLTAKAAKAAKSAKENQPEIWLVATDDRGEGFGANAYLFCPRSCIVMYPPPKFAFLCALGGLGGKK